MHSYVYIHMFKHTYGDIYIHGERKKSVNSLMSKLIFLTHFNMRYHFSVELSHCFLLLYEKHLISFLYSNVFISRR